MYLGAAWYPEHWSEDRWPEDVRLMREAGFNVCRIAEFAWSSLEPGEGQYEFGWLERAVALLHENGMAVVLGTPTAAPPAWLTHHHPDTLAIEPNGRPAQHGNRCHVSPLSTTFQKSARRIVDQMARRFGQDSRVIGWQLDNEYSRVDYSESARRQFQHFLREQYGTLDALNAHWSTAYWSQTYIDWNEIPLPIGPHNPGLMLAFRHFVTRSWRDFQKLQSEVIRSYAGQTQWITSNFMGWFDAFDHYKICEELDFATWDWYVGTGHHKFPASGVLHDLTRGFKRKNFWVMETQPGSVNWSSINNMLNQGEARCMAWHAIAHGADAILYWQWRSALGGQEQLHGSLLGADGKPRLFYREAQQLGKDFQAVGDLLVGTEPHNEVALLHSYDARWSVNWQRHHKDFDPAGLLTDFYRPIAARNVGIDIVSSEATLSRYKLILAPALTLLTPVAVQSLISYVENGGTLVLSVRCGQKDAHNALFPALQPGPLREIAGAEVEEFFALDEPVPIQAGWNGDENGECRVWAELLRPLTPETEILATFGISNGWLDGGAAVTRHRVGEKGGQVVVVGAWMDAALLASLAAWLMQETGVTPLFAGVPEGVEVARRIDANGKAVTIVINHNREEAALNFSAGAAARRDLLTGEDLGENVTLSGYGVRVWAEV